MEGSCWVKAKHTVFHRRQGAFQQSRYSNLCLHQPNTYKHHAQTLCCSHTRRFCNIEQADATVYSAPRLRGWSDITATKESSLFILPDCLWLARGESGGWESDANRAETGWGVAEGGGRVGEAGVSGIWAQESSPTPPVLMTLQEEIQNTHTHS